MNIFPTFLALPALGGSSAAYTGSYKRGSQDFAASLVNDGLAPPVARTSQPVSPLSSEQQHQEVFSFGSLGVFGRYGAQDQTGAGHNVEDAAMGLDTVPPPIGERAEDEVAENGNSARERAVAVPEDTVISGTENSAQAVQSIVESNQVSEAASSMVAPQAGLEADIGTSQQILTGQPIGPEIAAETPLPKRAFTKGRACMPRDEEAASQDAGSVTVSGDDSAISIVARNIDPSIGSDVLQHAFSDAAAEFGASVSEMLINGEAQNFVIHPGGNNGRGAG